MSEASIVSIDLPTSLPFPITITRLLASHGTAVSRGSALFEYTFTSDTSRRALAKSNGGFALDENGQEVRENDMVGTWESGLEGTLDRWEGWVKVGARIERKYADRPVVWLEQACTHPVQLHGMCGVCGKDLTTDDYLSRPVEDQAGPSKYPGSFEMSHDALGVTVSTKEARRLEHETRDTLLRSKRLSLIVDLDQTIIHTTVDPTVGEWLAEIDSSSAELGKTSTKENGGKDEMTTTPPGSPIPSTRKGKAKEVNPNAEALLDVARFHLPDDLPPGYRTKAPDRWYYTKPRPGLRRFLDTINEMYEMHVYTMGTRSYAEAICKVVDPDGKYFGGRIISRDENRNFNSKNLSRLFPTDQSMVVVIDDRADVWGDIPNLVKVVPYDFFIGIGDINSGFLPGGAAARATSKSSTPTESNGETDTANAIAQTKLLDAVSKDRPLAKMQEKLESEASSGSTETTTNGSSDDGKTSEPDSSATSEDTDGGGTNIPARPLLNNNDTELSRIAKILTEINKSFYRAYEWRVNKAIDAPLPMGCDVEVIIPDIKSRVLSGCTIVFSGVIPKHQRPEASEMFTQAEAFGALPMVDVSPNMTHCVTSAYGTEKTIRASKMDAWIVLVEWFNRSIALWEKQDERDYLARPGDGEGPPASGPSSGTGTPRILIDGQNPDQDTGMPNGGDMDENMDDDDIFDGREWDEAADAELDALLEGSSEYGGTEGDDTESKIDENDSLAPPSPASTTPGSPSKKRVRYADEESLPLETFQDAPPTDPNERSESPPRKRLLLRAPSPEDDVPDDNKFQWRGKMRREQEAREAQEAGAASDRDYEEDGQEVGVDGEGDGADDLFAQMLEDSMGD